MKRTISLLAAPILSLLLLLPVEARANILILKGTSTVFTNTLFSSFLALSDEQVTVHNFDGSKPGGLDYKAMKKQKPSMIMTIGEAPVAEIAKNFPEIYVISVGYYDYWGIKDIANVIPISIEVPPSRSMGILRALLPKAKTIGVMYNPKLSKYILNEFKDEAKKEGFELFSLMVDKPGDVFYSVKSLKGNVDIFYFVPDATVFQTKSLNSIFSFLIANNIPYITPSSFFLKENGILAMSVDPIAMGRFIYRLAERILKENKKKRDLDFIFTRMEITFSLDGADKFGIEPEDQNRFFRYSLNKGFTLKLVE